MKPLLLQETIVKGLSTREKVFLLLTALFFITFYLPGMPVINNCAIGLLCCCCFLYNSLSSKWQLLKQRPAIVVMLLFCVVHIISAFMSQNLQQGLAMLQLRSPLLLFPLSVGLIPVSDRLKKRVLLLYAVVTTAAAMVCLLYAFWQYRQTGNAGLLYNDSLTTAVDKQSVYIALMINLAIFSYVYLLLKDVFIQRYKSWVYAAIGFLVIVQFMLASRMEIIFLVTSAIGFIGYYFFVRTRKRGQGVLLLLSLLAAGALLIVFFPKTINRFREMAYPQYRFNSQAIESHYNGQLTPEQWNGMNIRLAIWKCGWELSKQHPVFGVSVGDKQDALMAMYKEKGFDFAVRTNKNMHSNYLDLLAGMGITGLLLFLAGYLTLPLRSCFKRRDVLGALMLTAFMASFITEVYIDRSIGCIIFAFIASFIIAGHAPSNEPLTGYPPGTV